MGFREKTIANQGIRVEVLDMFIGKERKKKEGREGGREAKEIGSGHCPSKS